ncbi:17S U2 SnRNP complex component HTATSF1-like [Cavia porcellus]|uniref:17S U2 SnRNP complex component HTATSF1-like n=1 Tax=Cavia porcellus TaxID=10141 RepID=UPI002FE28915
MQELYGDPKDGDIHKDPSGETESFGQQPADTPYEWDLDRRAWFPKITEDFIATYQANYGITSDRASGSPEHVPHTSMRTAEEPPQRKTPEPTDPKKRGEKRKGDSGWFHAEEDSNTNVYVSGLPPDITVDEFIQLMSKFGIIMRDPQTEEFKVKLYKDNQGNLKGDGLCCYLKRESVELALKLLDEDEIRGYKLHVEVAKFQLKGEYDASKKKRCKDYKKKLSLQHKQLDWRPERRAGPCRMRHERVVIIKNMFHPEDFEDDPMVLNEIREENVPNLVKLRSSSCVIGTPMVWPLCPLGMQRKLITAFRPLMEGGLVAVRSLTAHPKRGMGLQIIRWRRPQEKGRKG